MVFFLLNFRNEKLNEIHSFKWREKSCPWFHTVVFSWKWCLPPLPGACCLCGPCSVLQFRFLLAEDMDMDMRSLRADFREGHSLPLLCRERLLLTQSCDDFAVTGCQFFSYLFRGFTKLVIVHNLHWILIIQEEVLFSAFDVLREF